jgi:phytoene dehydrogenase-like protein
VNASSHYHTAIIGAGMSGLAAGIRLAHFGRRVVILERHNAPGGLNGFYSLNGRPFDVGLHAMTNFVPPGVRGTPLGKILRQLRVERDELGLRPQKQSRVTFGAAAPVSLRFSNDIGLLEAEIAREFPSQADAFRRLAADVPGLEAAPPAGLSARQIIRRRITDPLLADMLLLPLLYYGSPTPGDMDAAQFAIMFRALYLEGFARPFEGVRQIIRVLLQKYREAGGERRMKTPVKAILHDTARATALVLENGETLTADHILSTAGAPETGRLLRPPPDAEHPVGRLSFAETITLLPKLPPAWTGDTIVFFNETQNPVHEPAAGLVDTRSGVICFPNNFDYGGRDLPEGVFRCTCLANHALWDKLPPGEYHLQKQAALARLQTSARRFLPPVDDAALAPLATDMFTPKTIVRFTGRLNGAIYGSPRKIRDGRTFLSNLHLCGTDQGYLGITGALLGGITIANQRILSRP